MTAFPDPELSAAFRPYLLSGERLLWTGRPKQGLMFQMIDIFLIPFSFVWASVPVTMFLSDKAFRGDAPFHFNLVALLFLAIALYITVGRFLVDMLIRDRTFYAVSNRRVIALTKSVGTSLKTQDIRNLNGFEFSERGNGRGTIDFSPGAYAWWQSGGTSFSPGLSRGLKFLGIADCRSVYELIEREKSLPAS